MDYRFQIKDVRVVFKVKVHEDLLYTAKEKAKRGDLLHSDLCGPIHPTSVNGECYFQVLIDDYSHMVKTYLLKNKKAEHNILKHIQLIKAQFGLKTKRIRIYNGGEFTSKGFKVT